MPDAEVDWRHTSKAEQNREDKARTLAKHLYESRVTVEQVNEHRADDLWRRAQEKGADVRSSSDETWTIALDKLQAAYDLWGPPPEPEPEPVLPPGWAELVAAVDPLPQAHALCRVCKARAIIGLPDGWACAEHPPTGDEWGNLLNWNPAKRRGYCLARCYCGRCPTYQPGSPMVTPMGASALVDERAIASGKRRSSAEAYKSARAAEDARKEAEKARRHAVR